MIKPEFFSDEKVARLPLGARLLFIGIWNFADDLGVCMNNPRKILGDIFPNDPTITERQVRIWIDFLIQNEFLIKISYNSGEFLKVRTWEKHQIVANPSKKQWIPDDILETLISVSLEENKKIIIKEKEKEKGKEKEKEKEKKPDFIEQVLLIFIAAYKQNKKIPYLPSVQDKRHIGMIQGKLVKQYPGKNTEEMLKFYERFFDLCTKIAERDDKFLCNITIPFLNSQLNKYLQFLKNKTNDKYAELD